jgi:four helix bundle suffix protein
MIGAARSARQNIVEASARAGTSKETELKLLDVAKGSLAELEGDYEAFLTDVGETIWSTADERHCAVSALKLDPFEVGEDVLHAFSAYMLQMKERFAPWLENENPVVAANSIIVVIERAKALLHGQIQKTMDGFAVEGGFRERLTRLRLEQRENWQAQKANEPPPPTCPACGKPMRKRIAKSGPGKGKAFWGCSGYPVCKAIKEFEEERTSDL